MVLFHFYRTPALSAYQAAGLLAAAQEKVSPAIRGIETEFCFNVAANSPLTRDEMSLLRWLLAETFEPENFSDKSFVARPALHISRSLIFEVGPRMNFTTAWSTNAVSVCHACGLGKITRIERSRRYRLELADQGVMSQTQRASFLWLVHDRMTECPYPKPLATFETGIKPGFWGQEFCQHRSSSSG